MLKKFFSHTAIYGLAPQVSKFAYFLALPFITSDLTELDFGVAGVMTAYSSVISVFSTLGLNLVLVNAFYRSPHQFKWGWRQIYGFLTLWNVVYAAVLGLLLYFAIPEAAEENKWMILTLNICPLVFFGQTTVIGSLLYRIKQLPLNVAIRTITFGLTNVILSIIFIKVYKMGYMGWFWATFISGMLSNLSYWYPLNIIHKMTPIFNFKWRYIRNAVKVSFPTIPHYYSGYLLGNSDKMIMDFFRIDTSLIGKYNFANIVGNVFQTLSFATSTAAGPLINEMYRKKDDLSVRNLIFVVQILFFVLTFFFSIWTKDLFHLLIKNKALAETYPLAIIIIMGHNHRPMYMGANSKLFYHEKTKVLWRVSFIAGVTNVGMNLLLIPLAGFEIAAVTTFASYMYMGYSGFFLKTNKEIQEVDFYPVRWLVATIILTVAAYFAVDLPFWIKAPLSLLAFTLGIPVLIRKIKSLKVMS